MKEHGIQAIVIEEIVALAKKYALNKVILFGSRARGDFKEILEQQGFAEESNVAHSYNKEIALDIINQTKAKFYQMFEELKTELDTKWI